MRHCLGRGHTRPSCERSSGPKRSSSVTEIVILFGLARRTARNSRKYHYFVSLTLAVDRVGQVVEAEAVVRSAVDSGPAGAFDTCSGQFLCQLAPTLFRPFLAHFCSFFPRFFAVLSILPPRFRKPAPRPGKTVRNGRKTAGKKPQVDINIDRSRYRPRPCWRPNCHIPS